MDYSFEHIEEYHNPNEGRDIVNNNFDIIGSSVMSGFSNSNEKAITGATLESMSLVFATSESESAYVLDLTALFGVSYWISGSSGSSSLVINNSTSSDATGAYSISEGKNTIASGHASHAEGDSTTAGGFFGCHAEGWYSVADAVSAHAEGQDTFALGAGSHSEGVATTAFGNYSHAEGQNSNAIGDWSHVEGFMNTSHATYSHVSGLENLLTSGATNSAILGGNHITGTSANTLYCGYIDLTKSGDTPTNSGSTGELGTIRWNEDYLYIRTGKNGGAWGRVALDYNF